MAKTNTPVFTQNILNTYTQFVTADGTTSKVIATAGADDSRITRITITSTDTASNDVFLWINDGSNEARIGWVTLPITAGTDAATDAVSMIDATTFTHRQVDNNANPYFELQATYTLKMSMNAAVGATFAVDVMVTQEDY